MKNLFGVLPTGEKVFSYELKDGDYSVKIINYGAIIQSFNCFGTDIVGGFDTLEEYIKDGSFQGCIVGRVANRIKDAKFTLDGIEYNLTKNEPQGTLHGGSRLNKKLWSFEDFKENSVTLTVDSPDLEDGFPGNMKITVKYTLTNGALVIDYNAVSDKKTPICLTNHSFFNIDGLGEAFSYIGGLFGAGGIPFINAKTIYYLRSYTVLLIMAIVGATPLVKTVAVKLSTGEKTRKVMSFVEPVVLVALIVAVAAFLVDSSSNPFLYFRF